MRKQLAPLLLLALAGLLVIIIMARSPRCAEPVQHWPTATKTVWTQCGYASHK